jgi:outer membrane lipoprotein-sorting protein
MKTQQRYQFVAVIVLLGVVCSGCLETDADVDTLLQKTAGKQANVESLAYIEKLTLYVGNETETIEYDVLLKMPDKFRRIEKSGSFIRSEITSNGDIIWIYDPDKNIVFISNLTSSEKLPEPAIYVLLNDNISEKYMVIGQEMEPYHSTPAYKIELASRKSNNKDTREYLLWIDPDGLIPLKLESWEKGNPVLTLEYRDYSINCTVDDSDFVFTIPDDASVMYI